jgi:phage recombination protein Bet
LALFTKTVGKDLVGAEIDEALEWCELYQANPFTKDIYFFAFGKHGTDERRVVPVLSIGLYRKIASRSGNYRPDEQPPRFVYDDAKRSPANPTGMVSCEVTVYRHAHGGWHPITSRLRWEERAPIMVDGAFKWEDTGEVWADSGKPKRKKVPIGDGSAVLDPGKKNWHTMPETMMAKCTEVDAMRKGWPNETAGSYVPEEMDALHTIELTATEIIETHEKTERLSKLGDGPGVMVQWGPADALERVPVGKFGDRVLDWIGAHMIKGAEEPGAVMEWHARNREALREYWAHDKAGALEVKAKLENVAAFAAQVMAAE